MMRRLLVLMLGLLVAWLAAAARGQSAPATTPETVATTGAFVQQVDLAPLARVAAYTNGRRWL